MLGVGGGGRRGRAPSSRVTLRSALILDQHCIFNIQRSTNSAIHRFLTHHPNTTVARQLNQIIFCQHSVSGAAIFLIL